MASISHRRSSPVSMNSSTPRAISHEMADSSSPGGANGGPAEFRQEDDGADYGRWDEGTGTEIWADLARHNKVVSTSLHRICSHCFPSVRPWLVRLHERSTRCLRCKFSCPVRQLSSVVCARRRPRQTHLLLLVHAATGTGMGYGHRRLTATSLAGACSGRDRDVPWPSAAKSASMQVAAEDEEKCS